VLGAFAAMATAMLSSSNAMACQYEEEARSTAGIVFVAKGSFKFWWEGYECLDSFTCDPDDVNGDGVRTACLEDSRNFYLGSVCHCRKLAKIRPDLVTQNTDNEPPTPDPQPTEPPAEDKDPSLEDVNKTLREIDETQRSVEGILEGVRRVSSSGISDKRRRELIVGLLYQKQYLEQARQIASARNLTSAEIHRHLGELKAQARLELYHLIKGLDDVLGEVSEPGAVVDLF
ncbi:MAG: hypothetical protein KDD44_13080, partial [Bdellovibrionales bacterium]|nr:hypothetical protein [Bdellovibrionales bacterium]